MHLFDPHRDHDYYFELPREEERDALSITRCSTAHHGDVRAFPRAHRTFSTAHNPGHERGFGFIPNSAIDQHVSERHRERDMEPVVAAHPKLLGIGIDPNTIIVVHQDQLEVLGSGNVTITRAGQQQYSLSSGNHFDPRRRKPL
jgi:hypothetical protein